MAVNPKTYEEWEQLSSQMYRKWFDNNTIVVYKALSASRAAVDAWADGILETYSHWDNNQTYLAIYDISAIMTMTPYARNRIKELVDVAKDQGIEGRYALVLKNATISNIIRLFVRRELDRSNNKFIREFFHDFDEALAWIRQFEN